MPTKSTYLPYLALVLLLTAACGRPAADDVRPRPVERLDRVIARPGAELPDSLATALREWMTVRGDSDATRAAMAADVTVTAFQPYVDADLGRLDSVECVLGHALSAAGDTSTRLFAVISPYNQSVIRYTDGNIFIGVNHYLGADHEIYSGRFPAYVRQRKELSRLPADVMSAYYASVFPMQRMPDGGKFVNELLYDGALTYAVVRSMPEGTSAADVIGFTPEASRWVADNEGRIWTAMIERGLLYDSDPSVARRLLLPAPSSALIHADAPGECARYIGYMIARSYMEANPGQTVEYLLSPDYYNDNSSLVNSKYSPDNAR